MGVVGDSDRVQCILMRDNLRVRRRVLQRGEGRKVHRRERVMVRVGRIGRRRQRRVMHGVGRVVFVVERRRVGWVLEWKRVVHGLHRDNLSCFRPNITRIVFNHLSIIFHCF